MNEEPMKVYVFGIYCNLRITRIDSTIVSFPERPTEGESINDDISEEKKGVDFECISRYTWHKNGRNGMKIGITSYMDGPNSTR